MDPQQRLMIEVTWEAFENAAIPAGKLTGSRTGVFVGIAGTDYRSICTSDPSKINAYTVSGTAASIVPNRISYVFGLHGPCLALDTSCSSSLVALHLACQSLESGESSLAIAGGVNLILTPVPSIAVSQAWILAPDGRCKSFDASADGYVRGEGCAVVVLKRLSEALRDGDHIQAVIRGSAVNHGGHGSSLTAPNLQPQQAVIEEALRRSGVVPGEIDYVEAHGIGSRLTDAVEVRALQAAFGRRGPDRPAWMLGSVKTNIGHVEAAAGMSALIKVVGEHAARGDRARPSPEASESGSGGGGSGFRDTDGIEDVAREE